MVHTGHWLAYAPCGLASGFVVNVFVWWFFPSIAMGSRPALEDAEPGGGGPAAPLENIRSSPLLGTRAMASDCEQYS